MLHKLCSAKKDYIWGGLNLVKDFNKQTDKARLAESWELSTHKDGTCTFEDGTLLTDYINTHDGCLGKAVKELPFMIKLIDVERALSIQVHPSNEYARIHENDNGKTETWYVVDAAKDAFLYYGLNRESSREEVAKAIEENTILDLLNKVDIKKGDLYHVESGTIHAICANTIIYEIQQNSNATYRLYDYNRRDDNGNLRPLHIEKSLDVINYKPSTNKQITSLEENADYKLSLMSDTAYYHAEILDLYKTYDLKMTDETFRHLLVLEGELEINGQKYIKGDSVFIDAEDITYTLNGQAQVIVASL